MKKRRRPSWRRRLLLCVLTAALVLGNIGNSSYSFAMEAGAQYVEETETASEVKAEIALTEEQQKEQDTEAEEESEKITEEKNENTEESGRLQEFQKLLEAFPEEAELWWMSKEELSTLYQDFVTLADLYDTLDEAKKSEVEITKLEAAGEFFASFTDQTALSNTGDIYSIPSEYGSGIIYQGRRSTAVYGSGFKNGTYATNHSKDSNVWIRYPESGSCYVNGEHVKADVLVYYWLSAGDAFVAMSFGNDLVSIGSPAWCGYGPQDFTVEMEYHFFRAGTQEELSVDGYLFAHDLDKGEGICGKTGARGYYTSDNTTMKWKGQYVTGTIDDDRTDYSMSVGVAFHSDPAAPFHVSYHGCEYYSIELSSVGVDGQLLRKYGSLQAVKSITNPSGYPTSRSGFSMNLKGTSAYGDAINQTVQTNANGVASFSNIPMGTYAVSEQGTASYWDVPASGKVNIEAGQTSTYAVNNVFKTGNITLTKTIETAPGDAYNAEAEKAYHYNDSKAGFAYYLSGQSDSGIYVTKYGVTDANGKLTFSNLPVGTYTVKEIKASEVPATESCKAVATQELSQYVIPASQTVTVSYDSTQHKGNTTQVSFSNVLKKWKFSGSLKKVDEELKTEGASQGDAVLSGAVYGLYDGDKLVATATTDENGAFSFDGTYVAGDLWQVKEISASTGYLQDPTSYSISASVNELTEKDGDTFKVSLKNTPLGDGILGEQVKKQSLSFYKVTGSDKESSYEAVEGARFSIFLVSALADGRYAALSDADLPQAIIDAYRDTKTLDFASMQELPNAGEAESDSRGVVTTPALPYGRYIVVETETPENKIATRPFVLTVTGDDTDGTVKGDGEGTPLEDLVIAVDRPITSLIRIRKLDANSHKTVLKAGAGYVIHDTNGAWFNYYTAEMTTAQKQAYKEKYGDLVVQSAQGELVGTTENPYTTKKISSAESTNNVYVDTPTALPVGTYTLEEVQAPEGYILQGKEGVIAKKASITTGNQTFYETEETGAWDNGTSNTVNIVVSSEEAVFDTNANAFVIAASQQNDPAIGKISVYAEGEKLVSAAQNGVTILDRLGDAVSTFFGYVKGLIGLDTPDEEGLTEKELSEYKDYSFSYETKPIEGATFEIRAAEDIVSPEGGDNATKLFSKGDLVVTLVTDEEGQAWTGQEDWDGTEIAKGLPLGKYTITETKAGTGFALSEENSVPREIEITYAGQEVPVIYRDRSYENPRQKVEIEVEKLDAEENVALSGAVFGLYAEEDIVNAAGRTIVKAGTLLATGETTIGEDGQTAKATFTPDLPLGKYYIKELMAPMGYTTTKEKVSIDATYQEDQREVLSFQETVKNDPVLLQVNLMDYYTEEELDGATLQLIDEDGNPFTTILSVHENNTVIRGLEIGKTYTIQDLVSPEGYHYALYLRDDYETTKENAVEAETDYVDGEVSDSITVTIADEGKLQVVSVFLKPITGTITVEKTGEVPTGTTTNTDENGYQTVTPVYEITGLPGAEYALMAKEDVVYPDGYTGTLFTAGDEVLKQYQELKDTTLRNYALEITKGEVVDVQRSLPDGTGVHYVLKTNDEGKAEISGLPLGEYEVIEVKAPNGYYRDQSDCTREVTLLETETSGRTEEDIIAEAAFENARQRVQEKETEEKLDYGMAVTKYSLDEGSRVPTAGAAFTVYAKEDVTNIFGTVIYEAGTEIETAISAEDGVARFQTDFPLGLYVVKETKAPAGHYSSTKEITFDLADEKYNDGTEYLHYWDYVENAITVVNIKLTDDLTGNELAGASLTITDDAGNPVEAWITKTEDGYTIKGLNVDTDYYITETAPRDGYLTEFTDAVISSENAVLGSTGGASVGFKIQDVPTETDEDGITVKTTIPNATRIEVKNPYVIGEVRIDKDGEMLESWTLLDKVGAFVKSFFSYSKKGLEDVTFEVRAAEDIVHPDGIIGILYHKGDLVATDVRTIKKAAIGTTDATGTVSFTGMYLGTYEAYETKTAEGYVRDTDPTVFTLAYVDGSTSPVSAVDGNLTITNPRQKAEITVTKTDKETDEKLKGAVLGLYAAADIKNYSGAVVVKADTLLESAETDAEGKVIFASDLPLGSYYVKEISAPDGYELNEEAQAFSFTSTGDEEEITKIALSITNQPNDVKLEVKKSTITDVKPGETYRYTIDQVRNNGNCIMNELTLTDTLPLKTELLLLQTGTFEGLKDADTYSIWYKTNQKDEYRLWADGISVSTNTTLPVSKLGLASGERITAFQYRFGDVKKGFKELTAPTYEVKVLDTATDKEELVNVVTLSGSQLGKEYQTESKTITKVHVNKSSHSSGSQSTTSSVTTAKTGDSTNIEGWFLLFTGSIFVISMAVIAKRKKSEEK